jgi:hypothetical protein
LEFLSCAGPSTHITSFEVYSVCGGNTTCNGGVITHDAEGDVAEITGAEANSPEGTPLNVTAGFVIYHAQINGGREGDIATDGSGGREVESGGGGDRLYIGSGWNPRSLREHSRNNRGTARGSERGGGGKGCACGGRTVSDYKGCGLKAKKGCGDRTIEALKGEGGKGGVGIEGGLAGAATREVEVVGEVVAAERGTATYRGLSTNDAPESRLDILQVLVDSK